MLKQRLAVFLFFIAILISALNTELSAQIQPNETASVSYLEEAKRKAAEQYRKNKETLNSRRQEQKEQKEQEKIRIAVLPIETTTGMTRWWDDGFDPGRAITDMIVSGLSKSKRFIVLDRNSLDKIVSEQKLGDLGLVTPETAAAIGKLAGVQYMLSGTLVEFAKTGGSGGMTIPTRFGNVGGGGKRTKVRTALEVQLLNVNTGIVAAALSAKDETSVAGFNVTFSLKGYNTTAGQEEFAGSALGKSMNKVALNIVNQLEKVEIKDVVTSKPIEGYVMGIEGDKVFINVGSNDGVKKGMSFGIFRAKEMVDPVSGVTKKVQIPLTDMKIISVQDDVAVGVVPAAASKDIQPKDYAKKE